VYEYLALEGGKSSVLASSFFPLLQNVVLWWVGSLLALGGAWLLAFC